MTRLTASVVESDRDPTRWLRSERSELLETTIRSQIAEQIAADDRLLGHRRRLAGRSQSAVCFAAAPRATHRHDRRIASQQPISTTIVSAMFIRSGQAVIVTACSHGDPNGWSRGYDGGSLEV